MAKSKSDKGSEPREKHDEKSRRGAWDFLKRIREASKLAKTLSSLAVSLVILTSLALGLGPLPNVAATLGLSGHPGQSSRLDSAQSLSGDSTVSSRPTFNLIIGSKDVHVCQK
jgi:hypothetical protein